jgi:hypothetical protein
LAAHPVAAVIAVDINPSVELSLDAEGLVIEAAAMNSDAETLDLVSVLGCQLKRQLPPCCHGQ